jgi:hypothetical protein
MVLPIADFLFPICGTQAALAFFLPDASQTQKSAIGNQKFAAQLH